ncbi:hypothetical protein B2M23_08595 [Eubacterium limosum]|uniref:Uncharacterized protein n=1 Tax=Eubacterium limosum TaxID=1736 RepID=A0AAC9QTT9_EUBLI|nr:hypothetical protein B2M23_08595 [Eubacterium limosum]
MVILNNSERIENMKKIFILFISIMVLLSVTACSITGKIDEPKWPDETTKEYIEKVENELN